MKIFGLDITRHKMQNELTAPQGWGSANFYGPTSSIARTVRSDLENNFASVNAIVDELQSRKMFPTDKYGNEVGYSVSPIWWAINHPNDHMSGKKLISTLVSGYLVLPEVNVLLWHFEKDGKDQKIVAGAPAGGFTHETIAGFTILPRGSRRWLGGEEKFQLFTPHGFAWFGRDSVLTLKHSMLPDDGFTGVSPGSASHQEAQISDYLSQYQRGFFENGAAPAYIVTIYARTDKEFNAIRREYEMRNRGAQKQQGVVYQKVIADGVAGDGSARIEVTPVGSVNNSLAINDLVTWTQGKIDGNQGVSPLIYGDSSSTTYQNQQTVKSRFYEKVDNVMQRFLDDLQFELERVIRSELPFGFGYEVRNIEITDEQKTVADTRVANTTAFINLINTGATTEQATKALCLPEEWACLSSAPAPALDLAFSQPQAAPSEPNSITNNITLPETNAKGSLSRVSDRRPEQQAAIEQTLEEFARAKIKRIAKGTTDNALTPSDQKYVNSLLAQLQDLADEGGSVVARQLATQIKDQVISRNYAISENALNLITSRANVVIASFAELVDSEAAKALANGTKRGELMNQLLPGDRTGVIMLRITTDAVSESKNAFQRGQLDNAEQIAKEYSVTIVKRWAATGSNPCPFCMAMNGKEAGVHESFVPGGVLTADGATRILNPDYSDGTTPDAHSNCQCTFTFEVEQ